jgi:peptidoglycan/xylan/chitin deacetylase (PgdA/CDA1 family)
MVDGYKDNRTHLLPLLERLGLGATVYLEGRPLEERRVNWSHKFFWILDRIGPKELVRSFGARCEDKPTVAALEALQAEGRATAYHLKRVLKYDSPPAARNRAIDAMFAGLGGDERALCDELYMTWADARELAASGVELGGHTKSHEIRLRLDAANAEQEVREGRGGDRAASRRRGRSFAYPSGGAGTTTRSRRRPCGSRVRERSDDARRDEPEGVDPYELKRLMIDEDAELHLIAAEACGGFRSPEGLRARPLEVSFLRRCCRMNGEGLAAPRR